eukprot:scaffold60929_cov15-Tisochrysis_lutea.AAC.1
MHTGAYPWAALGAQCSQTQRPRTARPCKTCCMPCNKCQGSVTAMWWWQELRLQTSFLQCYFVPSFVLQARFCNLKADVNDGGPSVVHPAGQVQPSAQNLFHKRPRSLICKREEYCFPNILRT